MFDLLRQVLFGGKREKQQPAVSQQPAFSREEIKKHAFEYADHRDGYIWVKSPATWQDVRQLKLQCDENGCFVRIGRGGSQKKYLVEILWETESFPMFVI